MRGDFEHGKNDLWLLSARLRRERLAQFWVIVLHVSDSRGSLKHFSDVEKNVESRTYLLRGLGSHGHLHWFHCVQTTATVKRDYQ
jgi:hypothetical protein